MGTLDGGIAFVTGAGSGIGRGCALRLARDGADVALLDIDVEGARETAEGVRAAGRKAEVIQANAASERQMEEAASACVAALGGLDFAVANAGIARGGALLEMSLKDWQDQLDVNLTGVFLTARAAARRMLEVGRGGRIVCMASLAAEIAGPFTWGYSATKAGVRMMVRGWAQELGGHGITVNAIGPGIIETPLARMLAGEDGGPVRRHLEGMTPAGRVGKPEDVAGLAAWLCGPDASFVTGSYLLIDGGLRDARGGASFLGDPNDARAQEVMKLAAQEDERRQRLQPLLDER